ncbi:NYN domain-containing protein [Chloroflexi bacterium TSY]|nr:NYN domain-containing protein [Chloroflexi bacterium TSY]
MNYRAAEQWLHEKYGPTNLVLFNSFDAGRGIPPGLQKFYETMKENGAVIRLQEMKFNISKRVDVDIAAHMILYACNPDIVRIILTTGDGDFVPAVEIAQSLEKTVVLFSFKVNVSQDLSDIVDEGWYFEGARKSLEVDW